jgi:hyaluronoglucosaminidase
MNCFLVTQEGSLSRFEVLAAQAVDALRRGEDPDHSLAVRALEDYFTILDEDCYHLKFRMENLALRNNLTPWIELLEYWYWAGRYALMALRANNAHKPYTHPLNMMKDFMSMAQKHTKRVDGSAVMPLLQHVLNCIERQPEPQA